MKAKELRLEHEDVNQQNPGGYSNNEMEKPNYVLKANEGVLVPKNENSPLQKLKPVV